MADIFVSYATEDRDRLRPLVERLEREGWSVWWDRALVAGPRFDEKIEQELDAARCVVVAWSNHSVNSRWCRSEANEGLERNILVPLCIDEVRPPLAFRSSHTASLTGWPDHDGDLVAVLSGVRSCLGSVPPSRLEREPETKSIAVLPFTNMSADPDQDYFADGMTEDLIDRLAMQSSARVIARTSSFYYKSRADDVREIGKRLGVTHVVEGSVRRSGTRLRIAVQLVNARNGAHEWSDRYDRELDDVFVLQDEITEKIAGQLAARLIAKPLNVAQHDSSVKRSENTHAYLLMLRARHLLNAGQPDNLPDVESLLQQALQLDPDYVDALSELSRLHWQKRWNGLEPMRESARLSRELNERVLAIDPDHAAATMGRAWLTLEIAGDLGAALQSVRRAIELGPTQTRVLHPSAPFMLRAGRIKDAIAVSEYVVQRDPLSVIPIVNLGNAYLLDGRFDDAEGQYKTALALSPERNSALDGLSRLELLRGNPEQAETFAKQIRNPLIRSLLLACALFDSNHPQKAHEMLAKWRNRWPEVPAVALVMADYYAWTGDSDNAFSWLGRALEKREEVTLPLYDVLADPLWKLQRSDARWREFLEEMGQLPEQLAKAYFELRLPV